MRLNHFAKTSRNYYGLTLIYLLLWSTSRVRRVERCRRDHRPPGLTSEDAELVFETSAVSVVRVTNAYAKAIPGVRFNVADPGYSATDLNGHRGTQTVTEGTDAIVTLATGRYERSTRWALCVVSGSHMTGPFFSPKPCDSRTMYSGRALASS
jgi:hypothetical protein